jgi:hypothetical protein
MNVASLFLFSTHIPDQTLKPPFSLALLWNIVPDIDLVMFALFAPATVMFSLTIEWGSAEHGLGSPIVTGLLVSSEATLAVFTFGNGMWAATKPWYPFIW